MNTLHLEDQVSSDFLFGRPEAHMLHLSGTTISLISHQVLSGMEPGEFYRRRGDAWNQLNLQPSLASVFTLDSMAFRPSDSVLKAIISVYQRNSVCSVLENRIRLDETPALRLPIDCSLEVDVSQHNIPIFTKHPHTGEIVHHSYPYTTLPRFALPSTDPGLLGIAAYTLDRTTADCRDPCPLDIVQRFREAWHSDIVHKHNSVFYKQSPLHPSSPPSSPHDKSLISHKRKCVDNNPASPSKRIRIAATASRHIRPSQRRSDVASSLVIKHPSPLKRKQAPSQVQDCPARLARTTKRLRKDFPRARVPTRIVYERAAKSKGCLS